MTDYCSGLLVDIITESYMGNANWEFKARSFTPGPGEHTTFESGFHSLNFNSDFWDTCDAWAKNMKFWFVNYSPYATGTLQVDYWGEVGTQACGRYSWAHNRARGLDLCLVMFTNGYYMDSNWSHQAGGSLQPRRYLAVAANLRRYFRTVLTTWYNADHRDHIHFDNQYTVDALSTARPSDTTLVQAACNLLNGESLDIDGAWGPLTTAAYERLLDAFNLGCKDPLSSTTDAKQFLSFIVRHGTANEAAGYWTGGCG